MRVMVIVKATPDSEAGVLPGAELLESMGAFNQELIAAGLMIDGAGMRPSSDGARMRFAGGSRTAVKGSAPSSNDLIAGYWLWKVDSVDHALDWVKRCPHPHPGTDTEIEIRPLFEEADFL